MFVRLEKGSFVTFRIFVSALIITVYKCIIYSVFFCQRFMELEWEIIINISCDKREYEYVHFKIDFIGES